MPKIGEEDRKQLHEIFAKMDNPIRVLFFGAGDGEHSGQEECAYCQDTKEIVAELAEISDKIKLEEHDFYSEKEVAAAYGVDKIPALVLLDPRGQDRGVKFYGIPGGYEFSTLIEDILDLSRDATHLSGATKAELAGLKDDVIIKVFVTPT